jgi:hypothetical protein
VIVVASQISRDYKTHATQAGSTQCWLGIESCLIVPTAFTRQRRPLKGGLEPVYNARSENEIVWDDKEKEE